MDEDRLRLDGKAYRITLLADAEPEDAPVFGALVLPDQAGIPFQVLQTIVERLRSTSLETLEMSSSLREASPAIHSAPGRRAPARGLRVISGGACPSRRQAPWSAPAHGRPPRS